MEQDGSERRESPPAGRSQMKRFRHDGPRSAEGGEEDGHGRNGLRTGGPEPENGLSGERHLHEGGGTAGDHGRPVAAIEGGEAGAVVDGQREEIEIGEICGRPAGERRNRRRIGNRDIVGPKRVARRAREGLEERALRRR